MPTRTARNVIGFYLLVLLVGVMSCLGVTGRLGPLHAEEVTVTSQHLLTAATATTANAVVGPGFMPRCRETAVYVVWSAGVGAGAVTIESSFDPAYAGTWAPLQVVTQTGASRQDIVQITGAHAALRTRVSTTVTGGTVDTWLVCN